MFSIDMEMEWKSAGAEMADQIEFNTEQITRSKFEREKMTSDISSLVERMDYMEGKMTQQSQTFESKHESLSSHLRHQKTEVPDTDAPLPSRKADILRELTVNTIQLKLRQKSRQLEKFDIYNPWRSPYLELTLRHSRHQT